MEKFFFYPHVNVLEPPLSLEGLGSGITTSFSTPSMIGRIYLSTIRFIAMDQNELSDFLRHAALVPIP
jgi:hypothetical protein